MRTRNPIRAAAITRRRFLATTAMAGAGIPVAGLASRHQKNSGLKTIKITKVSSNFEREPLIRPHGFKGRYVNELWQTIAFLESDSGHHSVGLRTQNVLWSDPRVFANHSESGCNALMYGITERAQQVVKGMTFTTPIQLIEDIFPEIYDYATKITGLPNLNERFVINCLIGLDNAAWLLYAKENGIDNFDDLVPEPYREGFSYRHKRIAGIPLMAYSIPISEIKEAAEQGYFFMKIKLGQPGTQEEMLEKDKARFKAIHQAIGHVETKHTKDGKFPYYFDANGRYETKETLYKFLDYAKKIGAYDQIQILEEPFPEAFEDRVDDIGVTIAADESAATDKQAARRIAQGYGAISVKLVAKTLSMTMKTVQLSRENKVGYFCGDSTVNPILVDWNKTVASRLPPLPFMNLGLLESNGHQNYVNWKTMVSRHPRAGASWTRVKNGIYHLNDDFYQTSGGMFMPSEHYETMFK